MTDPSSEQISKVLDEGFDAYRAGISRRGNPYRMATDELLCIAWIRGYNWARTERALEMGREQSG